ncbi:MAG: polysaccharide deacetylase family protein [Thermoleophilia bacterium]
MTVGILVVAISLCAVGAIVWALGWGSLWARTLHTEREITAGSLRIVGVDDDWHNRPVTLRFKDASGVSAVAEWRVDGGVWTRGKSARIAAPLDHSNDGVHTVEVRSSSDETSVSCEVRIDTAPPEVRDVAVSPARIEGAQVVTLSFAVPPEADAEVKWAVVDTLGTVVGEQGDTHAPDGDETVEWRAATDDGAALSPGTYRLDVVARDAAGNETTGTASLVCDAPVKAELINSVPEAGNLVALTFDGGSGYAWRHIMQALAKRGAKGTFFCTGVSVDRYPEVAQEAVALGMTLGNHSYDHPDFRTISYDEARRQLDKNTASWLEACGAVPQPFFRPPYGAYNETTMKAAGDAGYAFVVGWDVDTEDWTGISSEEVARAAVEHAGPGSIILMHTQWNTQKAIPAMVEGLRAKGLEPVGLDELLRAAGRL